MEWKTHAKTRDEIDVVRNMERAQSHVLKLTPAYKAVEKRCRKRMERKKVKDDPETARQCCRGLTTNRMEVGNG